MTRRILGGRLQNLIAHSWQMYPIGLLFGLGFDTASEIGLLALAAGVATQAVPAFGANLVSCSVWRGHVVDGHSRRVFMSKAYGWALSSPLRKIYYDATTTGLSVAVALLVGTTELLQVLATQLKLRGEFLIWLTTLDFESLNYFIVALFAVGWACSVAIWKVRRVDEGWESVSSSGPTRQDEG